MTNTVRIAIEVVAGVLPGTPIPEYTKQFIIPSDIWYAQEAYEGREQEAKLEVLKIYGFAQEYARDLMNPKILNWVKTEWIYF